MATLDSDTFTRANQSGWGTASSGSTWASYIGAQTLSIASNEGVITNIATGVALQVLGTATSADQEGLVRLSTSSTTASSNGHALRITSKSPDTYYRFVADAKTSGNVIIYKDISGTTTSLTTVTVSISTNTFYWLRARIVGSNLYLRVWADGSSEPGSWTTTATDTSITGAGNFGLCARSSTSTDSISYDSYTVTDTASATTNTWTATDIALTVTDASTTTDIVNQADAALSSTETLTRTGIITNSDTLSIVDSVIFGLTSLPADQVTSGETATEVFTWIPGDTNTVTESLSYGNSFSGSNMQVPDVPLSETESIAFALAFTAPIDTATFSDVSTTTVVQQEAEATPVGTEGFAFNYASFLIVTEQNTNTESTVYLIATSATDTLSCSDVPLNTTSYANVDTLTPTDTFLSSNSTNILLYDPILSLSETQQEALTYQGSDVLVFVETLSYLDLIAISSTDTLSATDTLAFYNNPILNDTPLTPTDTFSFVVTFNSDAISGVTTQESDNFTRANVSGGWGTASDGNAWSHPTGTGTINLTSNEGVDLTTPSGYDRMILGSNIYKDTQATIRFLINSTGDSAGIVLRYTGTTCYDFQYDGNAAPGNIRIYYNSSMTQTTNTTSTVATVSFTMTTGVYYWMRAQAVGSTLRAKIWRDGTAEPNVWTIAGTDTNITSGKIGLVLNSNSAGVHMNSLNATDYLMADRATPSDAISDTDSFSFTDTTATSDSLLALATDIINLSDTALVPVEALAGTEQIVVTDSVSPSDTLVATTVPAGMYDPNSDTLSDFAFFTLQQTDFIQFSEQDIVVYTETFIATETLTQTEQKSITAAYMATDTLVFSTDTIAVVVPYVFTDIPLVLSDASTFTTIALEINTFVQEEDLIESIFFTNTPEQLFTADSVSFSYPIPLPDDPLIIIDATSITLTPWIVDAVVNTEIVTYQDIFTTVDQIALFEVRLYNINSIQQTSGDGLTPADSILGGQPAFLNDVALFPSDTIVKGGFYPLSDSGDRLFITESFFVLNNFTDQLFTQEILLATNEFRTLDRRADQYSTIVSDGPSIYYQCNENVFSGIFQKDGQDQTANASIPALTGAVLSYTWAQIEPQEGNYNFSLIDNDIAPWANQDKIVILKIFSGGTVAGNNSTHYQGTAGNATPAWVYTNYGVASINEIDGSVYPVYWDTTYQQKFSDLINALGNRYDINSAVTAVVASIGCFGQTSLDQSNNPAALALWQYQGYTNDLWTKTVTQQIQVYQNAFAHTPLIMSVDNAYLVPDAIYNIDQMISIAVQFGLWLEDEEASIGQTHTNPNWNIVPVVTGQQSPTSISGDTLNQDLNLASLYRSFYATVYTSDIVLSNIPVLNTYASNVQAHKLYDSSQGNKTLTVVGGVYPISHIATGDYLNGAQQCDGLTGYGYTQKAAQTGVTNWTLKATIYPTILPVSESIIVCNGQDGLSAGGYGLGIAGGSNGGPGANVCAFLPGIGWIDSGYALPQIEQWYSIMAVCNNSILSFYINGIQAPNSVTVTPLSVPAMFTVGAGWNNSQRTANRHFIGSIDEIALYNFALTPSRIASIAAMEVGLVDSTSGSIEISVLVDQMTIDDSATTLTSSRTIVDISLSTSDQITSSVKSVSDSSPFIYAQDNFNRVNQTGWGTATDGNVWTHPVGTSTLSISNNQGLINGSVDTNYMLLGTNGGSLQEGILHVSMTDANNGAGVCLRATDGNNLYRARLYESTYGIVQVASGSANSLTQTNYTITPNAGYWIRFRAVGSSLMAKFWADNAAEPAAWMSNVTDTMFTSGKVGIFGVIASGSVTLDNFYVIDTNLSDRLIETETLLSSSLRPPFVDTLTIQDSLSSSSASASVSTNTDQLTVVDTSILAIQQSLVEFLLPSETQSFALNDNYSEPLNPQDEILALDDIHLAADTLTLPNDVMVVSGQELPVDITVSSDAFFESFSIALVDPFVINDATTLTQSRTFVDTVLFIVDASAITNSPMLSDSVSSSDMYAFVETWNPVTVSPVLENIMPVVAYSDGSSDAVTELTLITNNPVPVDVLSFTESFIYIYAISFVDALIAGDVFNGTPVYVVTDALAAFESSLEYIQPMISDASTIAETSLETVIDLLADQVMTIDTIVTTVKQSLMDQSTPSDSILPTNIAFTVDAFIEQESTLELINSSLSDAILTNETTYEYFVASIVDTTPVADLNVNSAVYFFTSDLSVVSELTAEVEYITLSDVVTSSDIEAASTVVSKTDVLYCADTLTPTANFLPIDLAVSADGAFYALTPFYADSFIITDSVTANTATSFTGWVDLLYEIEAAFYNTNLAPLEPQNEIETLFVSNNEIINGSALSLSAEQPVYLQTYGPLEQLAYYEISQFSLSVPNLDTVTCVDASFVAGKFVPLEGSVLIESGGLALSVTSNDPCVLTDNTTLTGVFVSIENSGFLGEQSTQIGVMTPIDVMGIAENSNVRTQQFPVDIFTMTDASMLQSVFIPVETNTQAESLLLALSESGQEMTIVRDTSSFTGINVDISQLIFSAEQDSFSVLFVPIEQNIQVDRSTETLSFFQVDSLTVLEKSVNLGYGFVDSLYIQETLVTSQQTFSTVYGILPSGKIDGVVITGNIQGIMPTGRIDGVVS